MSESNKNNIYVLWTRVARGQYLSFGLKANLPRVLDALRTFERRSRSRSFVKIGAPLALPLTNFFESAAPARALAGKERPLFLPLL